MTYISMFFYFKNILIDVCYFVNFLWFFIESRRKRYSFLEGKNYEFFEK